MKAILKIILTGKLLLLSIILFSQQLYTEISPCGGSEEIAIIITDNDSDGIDDGMEQWLLEKFMPVFIRFDDDGCPGPSPTGAAGNDTNLVICRIFPVPPQYTAGPDPGQISQAPQAMAAEKELKTGMVWYEPTLIAHGALLYGEDCGLTAHTADVEGFTFTLQYVGNLPAGWRYDTALNNWTGKIMQTVSHAGTLCEKIETLPRLSPGFPNGYDTIFCSPDKHGNYLTIAKCNSGFLCDPACNGTKIPKKLKIVNAGEQNAPLVSDLGNYYYEYVGEDPWGDNKFLESLGGSAGKIKDKLLKELTSELIEGRPLDSCFKICDLYDSCFNCGAPAYSACIYSCDTAQPDSSGATMAFYDCSNSINDKGGFSGAVVFPNPAGDMIRIAGMPPGYSIAGISLSDLTGKIIFSWFGLPADRELNIENIEEGVYFLKLILEAGSADQNEQCLVKKLVIIR